MYLIATAAMQLPHVSRLKLILNGGRLLSLNLESAAYCAQQPLPDMFGW
jgi:hypothetical protein